MKSDKYDLKSFQRGTTRGGNIERKHNFAAPRESFLRATHKALENTEA
jgi:hypothetical protein